MFGRRDKTRVSKVPLDGKLKFAKTTWVRLDQDDELKKAERTGDEHGKAGRPGRNDKSADALEGFKTRAMQTMEAIAQDWREFNRVVRGEWAKLWPLRRERELQLDPIQEELKKADQVVSAKQKAYDTRRAVVEKLPPSERHRIGPVSYSIGLVAVFIIDVPLNSVVFNIFHAQPLETLLLATLLAILIVPAAHVLGIQLRNGLKDKIATSIATVVPLLFIVGIAYIRKEYLKEEHSRYLTGFTGLLVFTVFNLAVFTSAVFLSYLRHDPHEQALQEAAKELRKATLVRAAIAARLEALQQQIAAIEGRMAELRVWAEEELAKAKNHAQSERQAYERLMHVYCGANKAAREHSDEPVAALETFFESEWEKASLPSDLANELPDWHGAVRDDSRPAVPAG